MPFKNWVSHRHEFEGMTIHNLRTTGDRDLDCETALAERFADLVRAGNGEGWDGDEIANALLSLAQTLALDLRTDHDARPQAVVIRQTLQ